MGKTIEYSAIKSYFNQNLTLRILATITHQIKSTIRNNKTVIWFLVIFLGCYISLAGGYHLYLEFAQSARYYPDFFTHLVAQQTESLLSSFGYDTGLARHSTDAAMNLHFKGYTILKVVEGCNGISVLILFVSFVLAFWAGLKKTLIFALTGSVIIYAMNVIRIALLAIGFYNYPDYQDFMHGTLFPAIIYGTVFVLWVIWVKIATKKTRES